MSAAIKSPATSHVKKTLSARKVMAIVFSGAKDILLVEFVEHERVAPNEAVFASHSLHEVTMFYPMRAIRTHRYKLIHNLNHLMPFPIDQDFYLSPSFLDLLNRTAARQPVPWYRTLQDYYYRPQWQLFDLRADPEEVNDLAHNASFAGVLEQLRGRLQTWRNDTADPWLCAPSAVLEDSGAFKKHPHCLPLLNGL